VAFEPFPKAQPSGCRQGRDHVSVDN
jgi:hypothetical protein